MRAAIYDHSFNTEKHILSLGVRSAYLLADNVLWGGLVMSTYALLKYSAGLPLEKKMLLFKDKQSPEEQEVMADALGILKKLKKIKYKNAEAITLERKMSRELNSIYETWLSDFENDFYTVGFPRLGGEMLSDDTIRVYSLNTQNPEDNSQGYNALSRVMQGMPDKDQLRPDIAFLPASFFRYREAKGKIFTPADPEAANPENIYFQSCFTLPNILFLTEKELQVLRRQTLSEVTSFRIMADEWIDLCTETKDSAERLQYFAEKVFPRCIPLQQAYDQNPIVKECNYDALKQVHFEVMMGEVPVSIIMQFYRDLGVVADSTWEVLQKWMEEDEDMQGRWPVMALNCEDAGKDDFNENDTEQEIAETENGAEEVAPAKKFIALD